MVCHNVVCSFLVVATPEALNSCTVDLGVTGALPRDINKCRTTIRMTDANSLHLPVSPALSLLLSLSHLSSPPHILSVSPSQPCHRSLFVLGSPSPSLSLSLPFYHVNGALLTGHPRLLIG